MNNDSIHIDHNLLVLYLLDELSSEENQSVEAWINESDANSKAFSSLKKTWNETGKIEPVPVVVDLDEAWGKMKFLISKEDDILAPEPARKSISFISRKIFMYAAIAAMVILGVMSVVFTDWFKKSNDPIPFILESFAEVINDTLSDGSSIALNENSTLIFAESEDKKERQVELKGEAFFAVAADSSKPFVIDAGIGVIKVLGTQFNVRAYENSDLKVFVESGLVELSLLDSVGNPIKSLFLEAGEKGIISYEDRELYKSVDQRPDELFWANRKLIFRETELKKVFEILEYYYEFEIVVEHEAILNCLLSASFTDQDLPYIMEVIAASFELEIAQKDSTYQFIGKGCLDE